MVSSTKLVVLDTNFVLSCYTYGIHLDEIKEIVDEPCEIVVPQNVLEELSQLHLKGKDREARNTMGAILEQYPTLLLQGPVDAALVEYARIHDCITCTNDKMLRKTLKKMGRATIFVRARSHLEME
jgi:rRNA-processing protein FCF1